MDIQEVERRIELKHGNTVKILAETYKGFKKRAEFIDKDFGTWTTFVYAVCRGQQHIKRAKTGGRLSIGEVQEKLDKKFKGLVALIPDTWVNALTPCEFEDVEYGRWTAILGNILQKQCHGHPFRSKVVSADKRRYTAEEIQDLIPDGVILVPETYKGMLEKATFIDPNHGSYEAFPANLVHHKCGHVLDTLEKFKVTNQKKFGSDFPMQNNELALKNAKARRNSYISYHWKTGEELVCQAKWEVKVVAYLNANKIEYEWQSKTFKLPKLGVTYRPDFYLPGEDIWVDVKGWHTEKFLIKWKEFQELQPNSAIWDKHKLKELGIL